MATKTKTWFKRSDAGGCPTARKNIQRVALAHGRATACGSRAAQCSDTCRLDIHESISCAPAAIAASPRAPRPCWHDAGGRPAASGLVQYPRHKADGSFGSKARANPQSAACARALSRGARQQMSIPSHFDNVRPDLPARQSGAIPASAPGMAVRAAAAGGFAHGETGPITLASASGNTAAACDAVRFPACGFSSTLPKSSGDRGIGSHA